MNKGDFINGVVVSMQAYLDKKQEEVLKNVLVVNFSGYEITQLETLPSTIVYDNRFILERFGIDMLAKGLEESTVVQYQRTVKVFLQDIGKNYREVTGQDITDYVAIRQYRDKISTSYKATIYKYCSAFFKWAYKKHHIEEDVIRDTDTVKFDQKRKVRLSDMQVEDIRDVCTGLRDRAIIEFMLSTGARVSEIAELKIEDIDFASGAVSIYGQKNNTYRTGFLGTKSKKAIDKYLKSRSDKSPYLFVGSRKRSNQYGLKEAVRISKATIEEVAKKAGMAAGVPFVTTVHIFRKTFASIMYNKTADILFVSKLLGHGSTDVTVKFYLCEDLEDMKNKHKRAV